MIFAIANSSVAFPVLRAQNLGLGIIAIPIAYSVYNMIAASCGTGSCRARDSSSVQSWRSSPRSWRLSSGIDSPRCDLAQLMGNISWHSHRRAGLKSGLPRGRPPRAAHLKPSRSALRKLLPQVLTVV